MSGGLSIYPSLDVQTAQPPNLLSMGQDALNLKNTLNQTKLFSAQQAQSQLLAQNTNPDGSINVAGYQKAVAANPAAASVGAGDAFSQAQDINQKLLNNTGMSLTQHYTRLTSLYNGIQAEIASGGGKGIPAQTFKDTVLNFLKQGLITPQEAASAYTGVSDDPIANAKSAQSTLAGVTQSLQAITPVYNTLNTGNGSITGQSNPNALGGAYMPNIVQGVPESQLAGQTSYVNGNNQTVNTTLGAFDAKIGQPTQPVIGGGVGAPPAGATQQPPLPVIGGPQPTPQGGATPAPASPQAAAAAPGAGGAGGAIMGPAPGVADVQTDDTQQYLLDVHAGAAVTPQISSLQEILSAAPDASTGPAQGKATFLSGLAAQFNMANGSTATANQIIQKGNSLLAGQSLTNTGPNTDSGLMNAIHSNPGGEMTYDAIKATGALVLGTKLYQQRLSTEGIEYARTNGGSPAGYNAFKNQFAQNTSPLIMSLPYQPPSERMEIFKYFKTLPPADQAKLNQQYIYAKNQGWLSAPSSQ